MTLRAFPVAHPADVEAVASCSRGRKSAVASPADPRNAPPERGFLEKRLKGLEPSTFCMAKAKIDGGSR